MDFLSPAFWIGSDAGNHCLLTERRTDKIIGNRIDLEERLNRYLDDDESPWCGAMISAWTREP
jgi:hypothetical protein